MTGAHHKWEKKKRKAYMCLDIYICISNLFNLFFFYICPSVHTKRHLLLGWTTIKTFQCMVYLKILLFGKNTYRLNLFIFLLFKFAYVENNLHISFLMILPISDLYFTTFAQKGKLATVNNPQTIGKTGKWHLAF